MPIFDDVRRWVKDRFGSHDENINGTPHHWMRKAQEAFPEYSQAERQRNLEHLRAYATYYYKDHVPAEIRQELTTMEHTAERLNAVDQARVVLEKYGGPPSRETIAESLERSMKERERMREALQPEAQRESVQERESTGYRVRM